LKSREEKSLKSISRLFSRLISLVSVCVFLISSLAGVLAPRAFAQNFEEDSEAPERRAPLGNWRDAFEGEFPGRNRGLDYRMSVGGRTVSAGGAFYAEMGWSEPVWGEWEEPDQFFYGYVRPSIRGIAAYTVNSIDARVSIFPISFLGISVGRSWTQRSSRTVMDVDCSQVTCEGLLEGNFAIVDFTFGAGGVFLVSQLDVSDYLPSRNDRPFFEDGGSLLGAAKGDLILSHSHVIGLSLGDGWFRNQFIGVGFSRYEARDQGTFSERANLVGGHTSGAVKWLYAVGSYRSDLRDRSPFAGLVVEWVGRNGLRPN
jgi:hypothetical protein